MTEMLTIFSAVIFLLAGMCGMAAVVVWFQFDIPKIMGEMSVRASKRAVENLRKANEIAADDVMIIHTDEMI